MIKLAFHFGDGVPAKMLTQMAHPEVDAVDHDDARCCTFFAAVFAVVYECLLPCRRPEDAFSKYME